MGQWPELSLQHPHGGSLPSLKASDALVWVLQAYRQIEFLYTKIIEK